jgi:hypothetical protein
MTAIWRFRLLALFVCAFIACISIANLTAEFFHPPSMKLPSTSDNPQSQDQSSSAHLASAIALFRPDIAADYAVALAAQRPDRSNATSAALTVARRALEIGPHDSRLWLLLAQLQARSNPNDPAVAESLKMSYLTGPNRTDLIPTRLESVTSNSALSDSDLSELARGDVRAILTQLPDQRPTLVRDYLHASDAGKAFLKESVGTMDPKFVNALQGSK